MAAYGSITNLVGGVATLSRPANPQFMFILNEDTSPLTLTFNLGASTLGSLVLSAATVTGAPGGYLDSILFPLFMEADSISLASTVSTGQFGSGASTFQPVYPIQNV